MKRIIELDEIVKRTDNIPTEEMWDFLKSRLPKKYQIRNLIVREIDLDKIVDWLEKHETTNY